MGIHPLAMPSNEVSEFCQNVGGNIFVSLRCLEAPVNKLCSNHC